MVESTRRLDMRLTISGAGPYQDVVVELAVKFAEYVGASRAAVQAVSTAVAAAVASSGPASPPIDVRLSAVDGDVTVTTAPSPD